MFERDLTQGDGGNRVRRVALVVSILAAAIALGFLLLRPMPPRPALAPIPQVTLGGALRAGAPEFEAYRRFVTIDQRDPVESTNLLGQVTVVVEGVLHNRGDRHLTGVELRAVVYDIDDKIVAERIAVPVPKLRPTLAPGEWMVVHVNIDPVPRKTVRTSGAILINGFKFD